jgi:hypothetical protein
MRRKDGYQGKHRRSWGPWLLLLGGLLAAASFLRPTWGQQVHRNGFEAGRIAWVKAGADGPYEELAHQPSDQGAHDGQRSEYIKLNAQQGSHIYYQYPTGQAPINDELSASLWVKANRPGIQLLARVVLPNEHDPNNLEAPLTTVLEGDQYRTVGRWQRLELGRVVQLARQKQLLMQNQLNRNSKGPPRSVNFTGAYVAALILNLYGGPGPTEAWIDDLEIGPVIPGTIPAPGAPSGPPPTTGGAKGTTVSQPRPNLRADVVDFNGSQLLVGGKPFFFRGIRYTDTSQGALRPLRDAGFNTVFVNYAVDPKLAKEAVDLGFWLVPGMNVMAPDARLSTAEDVRREMGRFSESDAVLFWHLGGTLAFEQAPAVARIASFFRTIDPGRPLGADVWDGLQTYSRNLQLLGLYRWPLMTTLELPQYRAWLEQRRSLSPGTTFWTWVQTHTPDWYTYLLYNQPGTSAFKESVGPQPEHIRLLTYTALSAGSRGLGFWSDRFLAESHFGRDRLLCLALINQELEMLEPLLVTADDRTEWIATSNKDVKAAVLRTTRGTLVLPIWQGSGSQFVPGQSALANLTIVVPQVPQSQQAWEVTPGDVHHLKGTRVVGGTSIKLEEFGLTSTVVFTSDISLIVRFQEQCRARRQLAAQWTYDMARYEMEKVLKIEAQLEKQGHTLPDSKKLIEKAQDLLLSTKKLWDGRLFSEAYLEGQRALRPLRILMRAQWDEAVKGLSSPVASPYAVSFFTLPRHWDLMQEVHGSVPTANVLPGGDFELVPQRIQDTWRPEEPTLDDVERLAQRVSEVKVPKTVKGVTTTTVETPRSGKQCLMLQIRPKNPAVSSPLALERTLLAMTSPVVHLQPGALVQVSGWVRIPQAITASPDGALFYDSAGGEPLAIRLTEPTTWRKLTLYRRVPDSGTLHVTLALTGIGTVYFDDIRIEPLVPKGSTTTTAGALP